jgi:hypothetical protein
MMQIDSNIPCGNIIFDTIDINGTIHIKLNQEFGTITHWFYFKVLLSESTLNTLSFSIDNAGQSSFSKGWNNYAPFVSYDGEKWERIKKGSFLNGTFFFDVENRDKDFFVAYYQPYTLEKYNKWLDGISSELQITKNAVMPDYIALGDKSKPAIVIVARQHPGETMASFVIEDFISLIGQKSLPESLLNKFSILIFPLLNKSGVEKGFHRLNANGNDLNRCWGNDKVDEIKFVKSILNSYLSIHSIIDIHGDEVSNLNYLYYRKNKDNFQNNFLHKLEELLPSITPLPKQSFIKRFLKQLIRKGRILNTKGLTLSDLAGKEYRANGYTIEISAKSMSEEECNLIGQNLANALIL